MALLKSIPIFVLYLLISLFKIDIPLYASQNLVLILWKVTSVSWYPWSLTLPWRRTGDTGDRVRPAIQEKAITERSPRRHTVGDLVINGLCFLKVCLTGHAVTRQLDINTLSDCSRISQYNILLLIYLIFWNECLLSRRTYLALGKNMAQFKASKGCMASFSPKPEMSTSY